MSRKPIIAANWKMNIGPAEGAQFIESFKNLINGKDVSCDVVIIPPFTTIPSVQNALGGCSCIAAGAQNVSQYDNGAYTGEISTSMLNELGLKYVVLGHSERRQYFGETDAIINAKIKKAIAAGITPIFCIGETKDERLGGILEPVLEIQLKGGLKDLTPEEVSNLVIAYEPVWAIGSQVQQTIPQQIIGINGRVVQAVENINANEVPMDGSMAFFPKQDMSEIYVKGWNADGTIRTIV